MSTWEGRYLSENEVYNHGHKQDVNRQGKRWQERTRLLREERRQRGSGPQGLGAQGLPGAKGAESATGAWQGQAPAGSREGDVHLPGQTRGKEPGPEDPNQHGYFLEGIKE